MKSDKLIAVHNGALGDFLCAWPALLALARGMAAGESSTAGSGAAVPPERAAASPGAAPRLLFAGSAERMRWLAPLGYAPCPPAMRRALEELYGCGREGCGEADAGNATAWAHPLTGATVAWFCLDRVAAAPHPRIVPLPCLTGGQDTDRQDATARESCHGQHVTNALRGHLERAAPASLPWLPRWEADWPAAWRRLFGGWEGAASRTVVLVPGAGHRAKQWPRRRFAAVADALARAGYNPLYVLGPAELERGLDRTALLPPDLEAAVITPADHDELAQLLRRARLVVGNDSGPLHLAALHGTPVLALFGPAPAAAWRPHGAVALASPLACAPCSATLRSLGCGGVDVALGAAPCMAGIEVDAVLEAIWDLLERSA
jgi:hypothetical protein